MGNWLERTWKAIDRGRRFVTHDVWHIGRPGEEIPHGFVIKQVRVAILLLQSFVEDALLIRAAALTFATILAIVPFLAITFYVVQTFEIENTVYEFLAEKWAARSLSEPSVESGQGELGTDLEEAAGSGQDLKHQIVNLFFQGVAQRDQSPEGEKLQNPVETLIKYAEKGANPQALGIAGVFFVLTTVFGLMSNIESSFNRIWGLKRTRSRYRVFSDYLMITVLLPFLVVGVLGVTAALESQWVAAWLGPFAAAVRGIQYVVIWLAFTTLYFFVPNTRVRFHYALLAGVVAGTVWSLSSWAYVKFQIGLAHYSLLYSGFAQFPLFLMWVYASWIILLFGAELTFAYQNEPTFAMERLAQGASHAYREALGLRAMLEIGRRFDAGMPGLSVSESAEAWRAPTRLLNETLDRLERAGLVARCATGPDTYQPARSIERIAVGDVVRALRDAGREPSALRQDEAVRPLLDELDRAVKGPMATSLAEVLHKGSASSSDPEATSKPDACSSATEPTET